MPSKRGSRRLLQGDAIDAGSETLRFIRRKPKIRSMAKARRSGGAIRARPPPMALFYRYFTIFIRPLLFDSRHLRQKYSAVTAPITLRFVAPLQFPRLWASPFEDFGCDAPEKENNV